MEGIVKILKKIVFKAYDKESIQKGPFNKTIPPIDDIELGYFFFIASLTLTCLILSLF